VLLCEVGLGLIVVVVVVAAASSTADVALRERPMMEDLKLIGMPVSRLVV